MLRLSAIVFVVLFLASIAFAAEVAVPVADPLCRLTPGQTKMVNALWGENPKELTFSNGRGKVVVADLKGPGIITMIHFALPQQGKITRDVMLRIWWDGEKNPSVEAPLCDFFCDPNGTLDNVGSIFVNKKRGWNCYFPMPFAKSARIEVSMDSKRYPNGNGRFAPCYSYVLYRTLPTPAAGCGYFHASWRQQTLLIGKEAYKVFEAKGKGQWIGWNMTIRPVNPKKRYVPDENEMFYIDGEATPSIEWQGLEDAFGFSWGFPREANNFAYTGFQPYYGNGAAAYRFNDSDRISFSKSIRMTIAFGPQEVGFKNEFSQPDNPVELSSVAYWYQKEPHAAFQPMLPSDKRAPNLVNAPAAVVANPNELVSLTCGRTQGDVEYLAPGWDFEFQKGFSYAGFPTQVNHCWADSESLEFDLTCPKGVAGTLRLYIIDGDNFSGGRKESIRVAGKPVGEYESFQTGRWIEVPVSAADTASGRISVAAKNLEPDANAVVSLVQFVKSP